jgi:transposase
LLLKQSKHDDQAQIKRLNLLIVKLNRMLHGQKSEKLERNVDQLCLELEELYINEGERASQCETKAVKAHERQAPARQPLPEHLPCETQEIMPAESACPSCGSGLSPLGKDVSETLEWVPAHFKVIRNVRPKLTCRCCDTIVQAPAPHRPIARSYAGPALLSHMMVNKYLDHLPLYRQCQIYARQQVELPDSTMGDWVGGVRALLAPLMQSLQHHYYS